MNFQLNNFLDNKIAILNKMLKLMIPVFNYNDKILKTEA